MGDYEGPHGEGGGDAKEREAEVRDRAKKVETGSRKRQERGEARKRGGD